MCDWHLISGLCACKAGALSLELYLLSILLWLFCKWGLVNYLLGLASNLDPPDLGFPSRITDMSHWCPVKIFYFYSEFIYQLESKYRVIAFE
jgi:hypothetical protein